jgi:outer membrane protein OmpA-like peptidoglycan-associated protein
LAAVANERTLTRAGQLRRADINIGAGGAEVLMRRRFSISLLAAAILALSGCASFQRPSWNKPVGKGTYIPAAICALIGAGTGVYIQDVRPGESCLDINGNRQCVSDDPEYWKGALIGAAIGTVLCGVAGHVFLDPEAQPTPSAPPPPPPSPTPAPTTAPVVHKRIVLRGVHFDFNQSTLRPDSRPVLDEAVETLQKNPDVRIVVEGHTDSIGSDQFNQALSVRRAEAVYRYLVNSGVAPERMQVVGYGKSRPVATNATTVGRAQNRRVELQVEP